MSPITFKFFSPRGDCRRVTYDDVPELATINDLVDSMVEGHRSLSYRDSEGDVVLLKTSRDVVEAVKDANDSGAKSIKVHIGLIRECPRKNETKSATANNCNKNRNPCVGAGRRVNYQRPQWVRCWSRGLFGHPHRVSIDLEDISDELKEISKHLAPFFGIYIHDADNGADSEEAKKQAVERASSDSDHPPSKDDEHSPVSQPEESTQQVKETKKEASDFPSMPPVPTIEEGVVAENPDVSKGSGFIFVENEPQNDETEEVELKYDAKDDDEDQSKPGAMDDKLKLLKEMGFEIPQDVARNMIRELNGRMDLIVRALVANQK